METSYFSTEQINFLESYCPENSLFTSPEEIQRIKRELNIGELYSEDKYDLRNEVVKFYRELLQETNDMKYMTAMQSVTTVIDYSIYA